MLSLKFTAYPQNTFLQENTSGGLVLYVRRILKDLNYKKLLLTVVKRKLLTHKKKGKKSNKNGKGLVIQLRDLRKSAQVLSLGLAILTVNKNLVTRVFPQILGPATNISQKNYGKNCYLGNFVFLPPFLLLIMLRNNEQNLRQTMLQVRIIVQGERGIFKHNF